MKNLVSRGIGALGVPEEQLSNGFKAYFKGISTGLLSDDRIQELIAKKEAGDLEARDELVKEYLKDVFPAVKRYFDPKLPIDDFEELIAIGNAALVEAVNKCTHKDGKTFGGYIKVTIYDKVEKAAKNQNSAREIPQQLVLSNEPIPDPESSIMLAFFRDDLEKVLKTLTEREQRILRLRYGFETGESITRAEIGKIEGVTASRIQQIEMKALRRLRHYSRRWKIKWYLYS
ncbi:MAG: sigma-70 family RNA polymerase sigma factor [Deltaproteobacteria bacterium]